MVKAVMSSTKYVVFGSFEVDGYIDKPDLIGSFFGQTEGLIGEDLEFSALQKSGKLGRIEINLKKIDGKTKGNFRIPTALDKVEVSLVAAALESIDKISHCSGKIKVVEIRDSRKEKRVVILKRAEELLKNLKEELPETQNMTENINDNMKKKSIRKYGNGEIFGGPNVENEDEIILVEGRADVLNLLKHNISNVIAFNGSNIPKFISKISKGKVVTAFLDSDRGGKMELEELKDKVNLNYYVFAPDGKEVEDLNIKEINKCLKNKIEIKEDGSNNENNGIKLFRKIKKAVFKKHHKKMDLKDFPEEIRTHNNYNQKKTNKNSKYNVQNSVLNCKFKKEEKLKVVDCIKKIGEKEEFCVLNNNLRKIKSGNILEFFEIERLKFPNILIFNGVCESSVLRKAKILGFKIIVSKKKSNKLNAKNIVVKLFDDFK